jgi:spore germination cell wall hydrolase CwlJ-like protein
MEPFITCLALALHFEAGGESRAGQLAVADVIMTRVESKHYPNNICDVVFQRKQFSFVVDNKTPVMKGPTWERDWENMRALSKAILSGEVKLPNRGATHFHTKAVHPKWSKGLTPVARIGNHLFFNLF